MSPFSSYAIYYIYCQTNVKFDNIDLAGISPKWAVSHSPIWEVMTYERNFEFSFLHIAYGFVNNYKNKAITASG